MVLILTQVVAEFDKGHRPIWSNHEWELVESSIEAREFINSLLPWEPVGSSEEWSVEKRKEEVWYYHNGEPFKRAMAILLK